MLSVGSKAPDFSLPDQNGNMHHLSDYFGKKVLLFFYSKDQTSGCTKQALGYSELNSQFLEKGIVVLGISKDSVESHKKFADKMQLQITILADPELAVLKAYDVWKEKKLYGKTSLGTKRTTYVISEAGVIEFANDKVVAAEDASCMLG